MNIVLIGLAGSGKGTQAKLIAQKYGFKHISAGDVLRNEAEKGTELGEKIKQHQEKGELVPITIVTDALKKNTVENNIFDGFPRTIEQAHALDEFADINLVIYINIPDETAINRLSKRRQCKSCGFITDSTQTKCTSCNGEIYQRTDDTAEAIKKRLQLFHQTTEILLEFYKPREIVKIIDGTKTVEEIFNNISKIIDENSA